MDGVIMDEPGFLIGVVQITFNDVFKDLEMRHFLRNYHILKWKSEAVVWFGTRPKFC